MKADLTPHFKWGAIVSNTFLNDALDFKPFKEITVYFGQIDNIEFTTYFSSRNLEMLDFCLTSLLFFIKFILFSSSLYLEFQAIFFNGRKY